MRRQNRPNLVLEEGDLVGRKRRGWFLGARRFESPEQRRKRERGRDRDPARGGLHRTNQFHLPFPARLLPPPRSAERRQQRQNPRTPGLPSREAVAQTLQTMMSRPAQTFKRVDPPRHRVP